MKRLPYYSLWLRTTWRAAWSQAGLLRTFIALVLALPLFFFLPPGWSVYVSVIPAVWLLLSFLLLLPLTSYTLYCDLEASKAKEKAEVESRLASVSAELRAMKEKEARKPMTVGQVKERFRNLGIEGRKILNGETQGPDIGEWMRRVVAFAMKALREHLGVMLEGHAEGNDAAFIVEFCVTWVQMHQADDFREDCIDD